MQSSDQKIEKSSVGMSNCYIACSNIIPHTLSRSITMLVWVIVTEV